MFSFPSGAKHAWLNPSHTHQVQPLHFLCPTDSWHAEGHCYQQPLSSKTFMMSDVVFVTCQKRLGGLGCRLRCSKRKRLATHPRGAECLRPTAASLPVALAAVNRQGETVQLPGSLTEADNSGHELDRRERSRGRRCLLLPPFPLEHLAGCFEDFAEGLLIESCHVLRAVLPSFPNQGATALDYSPWAGVHKYFVTAMTMHSKLRSQRWMMNQGHLNDVSTFSFLNSKEKCMPKSRSWLNLISFIHSQRNECKMAV